MLMGLGVVCIILWSVIGASESSTTPSYPKMTNAQIKAEAQNVSYDSLYRYNERYVGKIIVFNGTIIQVQGSNSMSVLRVNMNDDYDQTVYVHYSGPRVLENDNIKIWGRVSGLKTYEALFGNSITIPEIQELISIVN